MLNLLRYNVARALRKLGFFASNDPRLQAMQADIVKAGGIKFKIEVANSGEWVAESTNVDGIITGGSDFPNHVSETIEDAVFTYYEIPPELCKEGLIKESGSINRVEERVYA